MTSPVHLRWIEGSNDQNDTLSEVVGYVLLLLVLALLATVGGEHEEG